VSGSAQVVVIGGGPLGASVTYWLARAGCAVSAYEAGVAGVEGASRHSGGMTRSVDPDPVLDRLSFFGTRLLNRWRVLRLPGSSPLRAAPLWWLLDADLADTLRRRLMAGPAERAALLLTRTEAAHRAPALRDAQAPWVLHDPSAGTCDVRLLVRNLLWGAQKHGARVYEHCPVHVAMDHGGAVEMRAEHADRVIDADLVVLTMGQGLPRALAASRLTRRSVPQVQVTHVPPLPGALIDALSGTYLRPGAEGDAFVGWSGSPLQEGQSAMPDLATAKEKLQRLADTLGWPRVPQVLGLVPGSDAYTENFRPLCEWSSDGRSVHAGGLSGRGLKYAPLLGAWLADTLARRLGHAGLDLLLPELGAVRADLDVQAEMPADAC
jgi:glycine/D-amino acid oxidase-like deaminating enzyme